MSFFRRLGSYTGFLLASYIRSGRIAVEAVATLVIYALLFRPGVSLLLVGEFHAIAAMCMLTLSFYTSVVLMGQCDRPQAYLLLTRRIGRSGYLLAHYISSLIITGGCYLALSALCAATRSVSGFTLAAWALGSLPLLLNVAILAAAVTLLAPAVLSTSWRLVILAGVVLAFSESMFSTQTLRDMPPLLLRILDLLQLVFSIPLLPVLTGFALTASHDYRGAAMAIPFAQISLMLGLLGAALFVFSRREITVRDA